MTITRTKLMGKKVYDAEAGEVGEVTDIGFSVGEGQATLVVKAPDRNFIDIPWDAVGSAKDIILVKAGIDLSKFTRAAQAVVTPQAQPLAAVSSEKKFCTSCGKPLTWVAEYKRWYCYNEKKYV